MVTIAGGADAFLREQVTTAVVGRQGRQRGSEITFACPTHDDAHPSASYNIDKGVWLCRACGESGNTRHLARFLGLVTHDSEPDGFRETRRWSIRNLAGVEVAVHVRLERPGEKKRVVWQRNGHSGLQGLSAVDLPLYGTHYLASVSDGEPAIVTEGEKAADSLTATGFLTLGTVTGANVTPSIGSLLPLVQRQGEVYLWPDNDDEGQQHMRNIAARLAKAGKLPRVIRWDGGPTKGDAYDFLKGHTIDDVRALMESAEVFEPDAEPEIAAPMGTEPTQLTDTTNAELIAELFGDRLRYDFRRDRWLVWSAHRWQSDTTGEVYRLATDAARERYRRATTMQGLKERQRVAAWAIGSENRGRLEAAVSLARNLKPIADSGDDWDSDPWLLGCANGVVELRTGELRDGRPEDRVTMSTGIAYDPKAKSPRFQQFLVEVFENDTELVDWLWRWCGYSLSGDTSEQCLLIGYGLGANGKGRLAAAIRGATGDYAHDAPFSTFELHQRASIPNDLAALEHRRFVTSSETNDGTRLNEARIKALTGGDPIAARYLHAEFFTFAPSLKLNLFVNHKPRVTDDSYGFWRRVRLVPFNHRFEGKDEDKKLDAKLAAEAPGILAWLVLGCLEWQRRGLSTLPKAIGRATAEYEAESDTLVQFVEDVCERDPAAKVAATPLFKAYQAWALGQGMRERETLTATAFGRKIGGRFGKKKIGSVGYYLGIKLPGSAPDYGPERCPGEGQENARHTGFADSKTGFTSDFNVFSSEEPRVEKNMKQPGKPGEPGVPEPKNGSWQETRDAIIGMTTEEALAIWRSQGAPLIHVGPGQKCLDLERFLRAPQSLEHIEAVDAWLIKHRGAKT